MGNAVFIDANQYLTLYELSPANSALLLSQLEQYKAHIFIPTQIVDEVLRRKTDVAGQFYSEKLKDMNSLPSPDLFLGQDDERLARYRRILSEARNAKSELGKIVSERLSKISASEDDVSVRLDGLFSKAVVPTPDQIEQARQRREKGNPPGKQKNPLGDQIAWEQLVAYCKTSKTKRLWVISGDGDYFTTFESSLFLNALLRRDLASDGAEIEVRCFSKLGAGIKDVGASIGVDPNKLPTNEQLEKIDNELQDRRDYILRMDPGAYFLNSSDPYLANAHFRRNAVAAIMSSVADPLGSFVLRNQAPPNESDSK